jgi:hypothetical protein
MLETNEVQRVVNEGDGIGERRLTSTGLGTPRKTMG